MYLFQYLNLAEGKIGKKIDKIHLFGNSYGFPYNQKI